MLFRKTHYGENFSSCSLDTVVLCTMFRPPLFRNNGLTMRAVLYRMYKFLSFSTSHLGDYRSPSHSFHLYFLDAFFLPEKYFFITTSVSAESVSTLNLGAFVHEHDFLIHEGY